MGEEATTFVLSAQSGGDLWFSAEWVAIIVALLLGLAGIFQQQIRGLFFRPKLRVSIQLQPPDCLKIPATNLKGEFVYFQYQLRIRVENVGRSAASGLEAMVVSLERLDKDKSYKNVDDFPPLNLFWADYRILYMEKLQVGFTRHLDLGHVVQSEVADQKVEFRFDTVVRPNSGSTIVPPGTYRVTLRIGAQNVTPFTRCYVIRIEDRWSDDEKEMLTKNIHIESVARI